MKTHGADIYIYGNFTELHRNMKRHNPEAFAAWVCSCFRSASGASQGTRGPDRLLARFDSMEQKTT